MPRNIIKNAIAAAVLLLLAACASQPRAGMQADLAQRNRAADAAWPTDITPLPDAPAPKISVTNSMAAATPALVNQMNNGDVEVFSLDDAASGKSVSTTAIDNKVKDAMAAPLPPAPMPPTGILSSRDSAVTVYPIGQPDNDAAPLETTPNMMPATPIDDGVPPPTLNNMPGEMTPPPSKDDKDDMQGMPPISSSSRGPARVYFADNSARLSKNAQHIVRTAAQVGGSVVSVEGHASTRAVASDPVQDRIVNLKISMQRAIAVSRRLVADGVSPAAIKLTAFGDTHPSLPLDGKDAEAASRRVEIYAAAGSTVE